MKKIMITLAAALSLLTAGSALAAERSFIEEVRYTTDGIVDIELEDKGARGGAIKWTGAEKVEVRDAAGKPMKASISRQGRDSLSIFVEKPKIGEKYSFAISGFDFAGEKDVKLSSWFVAEPGWRAEYEGAPRKSPGAAAEVRHHDGTHWGELYIHEMEFEKGGRLDLEFKAAGGRTPAIDWDGREELSIADAKGKYYPANVIKMERDELKLRIGGLTAGERYSITIKNIQYAGKSVTLSAEFVARDGWRMERR
ncbi:MAG: hypothetical protein Q4D58_09205 [Synergistaceae bacterium]|nr:hypothetical protein [Synergistaceae bacterium]